MGGEKPKRKKTTAAELPEELSRKRVKTTAAELPEEVIRREILTRLPIKSVVRFKCVSKSWLSLFSNPQFIKQHLALNITQNPNDYDRLVAKKGKSIVILSRYGETFALPCCSFRLSGCVRGLVCLVKDQKLSLWNPAIHQSKEFTLPPHRRLNACYHDIGFGFDSISDNYKVVVLSRNLKSASVYYSNSDNWIDISVPDNVFLENRGATNPITVAKDCPHWTFARYTRERHPYKPYLLVLTAVYLTVVRFDTGSNEFKLLPEFYVDLKVLGENYAFKFKFVDMNDCLSLIVYDRNSKCMLDIYSLVGEEGCCVWSKMYSIGPLDFCRRRWFVSQVFYGGEIVLRDRGIFSCYDHKKDTIKCLSTNSTTDPFIKCFRYTPSLVFLEGMKSVYLTTQTRGCGAAGLCSRVPRRLIKSLRT